MLEFVVLCVIAVAGWFFWQKKRTDKKHNRITPDAIVRQEPIIGDAPMPVIKRTAPDQVELNLDPLDMPFESDEPSFDGLFTKQEAEERVSAELDAALNDLKIDVAEEVATLDIELDSLHVEAAELDAELAVLKTEVIELNAELDHLDETENPVEDMPLVNNKKEADKETSVDTVPEAESETASKVVAFAVMSQVGRTLSGEAILDLFSELGLTFVEGAGFYLKAVAGDIENPLFTVANMVSPGTFEPTTFVAETTPGVLLFTRLENNSAAWERFTAIAETAETLTERLDGVLCDEQHKAISPSKMVEIQNEVATFVANHA